ncbi:subtilisin-like protease SBT5.4 [Gastrolobium bilobum]|uniref:subtilisin-like protease SBT5.4 n=1 Tax=Gastrolobium bilobum TaxID=150636 RepID=UPI002AAFC9CA|nr:subtilisin-like protease SBT5.4 [Gastrolobium bilobum]
MGSAKHSIFLLLSFILFSLFQAPVFAIKKSYIVYLGSHEHGAEVTDSDFERVTESHYEFLQSYLGSSEKSKEAIIYSYTRHINGFAAILEEEEAADIANHPNVVSVFLNRGRKLHTTHSWEFMSLEHNGVTRSESLFRKARFGEDAIIGNLDTGVWPESPSFRDEGIGPIPSRWKGTCQSDTTGFRCNRKLIGARYFSKGYSAYAGPDAINNNVLNTARDYEGHGSHTLSTMGGNFVPGANVFGLGNGTAKGGSPKSRVATYKVCWQPIDGNECFDADIMAAFDMAIHDGVDVLSLSLGGNAADYFDDGLSIGAFHAVKKGIPVICSAGNSGPTPGTVSNIAPWILTVGASTLDREFDTSVELQNGKLFKGASLSKALPEDKYYPLISAAQAKAANASVGNAILCKQGTIDPQKVKGQILVCLRGETARVEKSLVALEAGAAGMILCNDKLSGDELIADPHLLPASQINYEDGLALFAYINSTKNPLGYIHPPQTKLQIKPAPVMAAFSSRGPNTITPEILKPDVTAPGVNIIAAYSEGISPTEMNFDTRRVPFITMSGTSMSCPHVAGVVGLLKTLHPDWSPSAIKSAIITTARIRDNDAKPMLDGNNVLKATPFAYGSGHIRPNGAMDPGLVYDLTINDYLNFLCISGYNQTMIKLFPGTQYRCPDIVSILDFNYPTVTIPKLYGSVTLNRNVKNVGSPGTYTASLRVPAGLNMSVEPNILKFDKIGEEKSFKLTVEVTRGGLATVFGGLTWSDGKHHVRSTIVVGGVKG